MIKTKKKDNELSTELTFGSQLYQLSSRITNNNFKSRPSFRRYNITICNNPKFVWFRVAKVATRSILRIFQQAQIELRAEHPLQCFYPPLIYSNHYKFAFVRNPWDRVASCWRNKVQQNNSLGFRSEELESMRDINYFVQNYLVDLDINNCNVHLRAQSALIDLNRVDFIGRFERFDQDISHVMHELNIKVIEIPKNNQSRSNGDYSNLYDSKSKDIIANLYRKDIQLFSYEY